MARAPRMSEVKIFVVARKTLSMVTPHFCGLVSVPG